MSRDPSTGSREAVACLPLPQNVACGFTALASSTAGSRRCKSFATPHTGGAALVRCYFFKFAKASDLDFLPHGQSEISISKRLSSGQAFGETRFA
jgi:hypothetical protein